MPVILDNVGSETLEDDAPEMPRRRVNERTEAKFFEDADKVYAEAENLGSAYLPLNDIAELVHLTRKRTASQAARTANQSDRADEESARNRRQNLYKPLAKEVSSTINYAVSAGVAKNEIEALRSISRSLTGTRAGRRGANSISVSNKSSELHFPTEY